MRLLHDKGPHKQLMRVKDKCYAFYTAVEPHLGGRLPICQLQALGLAAAGRKKQHVVFHFSPSAPFKQLKGNTCIDSKVDCFATATSTLASHACMVSCN